MDSYKYILECHDLSKSFGGTHALSNVDMMIRPGTVHALMGENGAGKSTLMKIDGELQKYYDMPCSSPYYKKD